MKRARSTEEQIIGVLKEQEAGAKTAGLARRQGVSEATIYNWKAKYGGLEVSEAKRLRCNRCTDPTYSGWFLRGRSARDVEELEQWLTKLMRCQTLV
ncbi:hypothetical protein GCM10017612_49250 [Novosphingobium resinovorum]|nr:hypothetical protein GCM10017612_49250 [Novosphingobium resinovorum]